MPLIKSISGIRGTIGGKQGSSLTPIDIVTITAAFGKWIQDKPNNNKVPINYSIVIGQDARRSSPIISQLVTATLQSLGIHVIDAGLTTTPTLSMAVSMKEAHGGIMVTASHNAIDWNAIKLFDQEGVFIHTEAAKEIFQFSTQFEKILFADSSSLGSYTQHTDYLKKHIEKIVALPLVNIPAIQARSFKIAVDGINSTGGIVVPQLLKALGVQNIVECYCVPNGMFHRNPEPLPQYLKTLATMVIANHCDLGIAVDPDVDRLAILDEQGNAWGEDYTLVAVSDYLLQHQSGNVVANLSSTNALRDITLKYGGSYFSTPVGEAHVVSKMKTTQAVIGGEGNGGVIYPTLHYTRDALVGIALLLSHLATSDITASELKKSYPHYVMIKKQIKISSHFNWDTLLLQCQTRYKIYELNREDGLKIIKKNSWIHLRVSNTEPIMRIYAEATTTKEAEQLMEEVENILSIL